MTEFEQHIEDVRMTLVTAKAMEVEQAVFNVESVQDLFEDWEYLTRSLLQ